jgi:hypothetical protein
LSNRPFYDRSSTPQKWGNITEAFCRIRGVLATLHKERTALLAALQTVMAGGTLTLQPGT